MSGETAISVCIVCRNEADRIEDCLKSVRWAGEVIVMDLQSSDASAEIAQRFGARVISREPHPIVEPLRNEIAEQARGRWILALDPDERVTDGLAAELLRVAYHVDADAVVMPRMNIDFGYAPSSPHQRYEPQLRMYRRDRVSWPSIPNALPQVPPDRIHRIAHRDDVVLTHIRNRSVPEALERAMRYAPAEAQSMIDNGERFTARGMAAAMATAVDRQFISARAWRDGVPGLIRAGTLVAFKFSVWAAFWQLSERGRAQDDDRYVARRGAVVEVVWRAVRKGVAVAGRVSGERTGGQDWRQRAVRREAEQEDP